MIMTTMNRTNLQKRVAVLLALLFCLVGMASADTYVGGLPLTTVQTGTVSGGLWYDATPPTFETSVTKDFTLPAAATGSNVKWARLYVSAYNGHMQEQRHGSIAIQWDTNRDGSNEMTWSETLNEPFAYIINGGNDNTGDGGGSADPYVIVNDHCNRVTSDYLMWYDVQDLLTSNTVRVNAVTTAVDPDFDGRIKEVALVVAYDDGDSDQITYWVNQGHDSCSYYTETNNHLAAVGSTTFGTGIFSSVDSAQLTSIYMASNNGYYGFPTAANNFVWTGGTPPVTGTFTNLELDQSSPDVQGDYSGVDSWDVTSSVDGTGNTVLGYSRYFPAAGTAAFYKIPLALLTVEGTLSEDPPTAAFSATPDSGLAPLTVQFTDESTGGPTSWEWDFDDGTTSTEQNPEHVFNDRLGIHQVSLTAINANGDDTINNDITVLPIWEKTSGWDTPNPGTYSAPGLADLDNDGDNDLLVGVQGGASSAYENTGSVTSPTWTAKITWNAPDIGNRARTALADLDGDGDFDLLVGGSSGISYGYENTGTTASPSWTAKIAWNIPTIGGNAAPVFADLDGDGDYDLLIGSTAGPSYGYENTGSASGPVWTAKAAWNAPDIGDNSAPGFVDIDFDGDNDLLIGDKVGKFYAYENTGSASGPAWTAHPVWDGLDIDAGVTTNYAIPGLADLDNDGDFDLMAGSNIGISYGYRNIAPAPTGCDLIISGIVNVAPPSVLFARESNDVVINTIKNNGPGPSPATEVLLTASDGFSARAAVPALAKNGVTTVTITDTTIRDTAGSSVTYTATVDPENAVAETDETNNVKSSSTFTTTYNGYKGKRYWSGGSDVTTDSSYDLHGGLVHSFGDSVYRSGSFGSGWTTFTVTWTAADLPIPAGATIREARLYVPYTWDNSNEAPDDIRIDFNSVTDVPYRNWYHDVSNFGSYYDHVYGLLTYDVTTPFRKNDVNTAVFTRQGATDKFSPYGFTLAVVYEDASATRKQIFLNEEFDLLGADASAYATTPEEATAYIPFSGQTIAPAQVSGATLITFAPSANGPEGDLLFNGDVIATSVWDYGLSTGTQVAVDVRDVTSSLTATGNEAGIRSTAGSQPTICAAQQFLVVEYSGPVAGFSATPTSGMAPLTVAFTDTSTGSPTSWAWEFGDGGTSTDQNPSHEFTAAGTYTVKLTVTDAYGSSDIEEKTGFITVTSLVPDAVFAADKFSGLAPLSVTFTDQSTNAPTSWKWEYQLNDGWTEFGSGAQNPTFSFTLPGTYNIRLTATNSYGSDVETKLHLFAVSGGRDPLKTVQSGSVTGDLLVQSYGLWSATETTRSFTVPEAAIGNIQWARLYVNTYGGSAANTYGHESTVEFDGNGDGDFEDAGEVLGLETCDIGSEQNGNSYPLGDHITKTFSDYEAEYDVTGRISAATVSAHVKSEEIDGKTFDGRLKTMTLVVAYDNPSSTTVTRYWVNHGQDWFSETWGGDTGSTTFSTSSLEAGFDSAVGTDLCTSSAEGTYTFNGVAQSTVPVNPTYFAFHTWDLKDEITAGSDSTLVFGRGSEAASFKTTLATLAVKYPVAAPDAQFTMEPDSGDYPLDVTFTDTSTGSITGWDLDYGDGSAHGSGSGPWMHTYTSRDTYTATLTVTGPGGTDTATRTITVKEPAPVVTFTLDPASGVEPLSVDFDATNTGGAVTSWKWEYSADSGATWTEFATVEDPENISFNDGTYSIRVTATGPDDADTETRLNCIQVGGATIEVGVSQGTITFGTMQAGVDATGQTQVTVTTDGGSSWSVTAADGKAQNTGYMVSGTTPLAGAFQLSNNGGTSYNSVTSAMTFMTGSGAGTWNQNADVKQAIASGDAPGNYAITVTFTGGFT